MDISYVFAAMIVVAILVVLLILPGVMVRPLPSAVLDEVTDPKDRVSIEHDRLKLRNEFRTTCVSFVGGLVLIAGVLLSFQQFRSSQDAVTQQLEIAQQAARNQQYVDAVKNLADTNATVRVAAVEVIDDIAQLNDNRRVVAASILEAYVLQRAAWPPPAGEPFSAEADASKMPILRVRHPDVALVLLRLGQRDLINSKGIVLSDVDLRGADFRNTDYSQRYFERVHMAASWLEDANFSGATIAETDLTGSNLRGTKLCGAWLRTANLTGANLKGATADAQTAWPEGFDHVAAGVKGATGADCT